MVSAARGGLQRARSDTPGGRGVWMAAMIVLALWLSGCSGSSDPPTVTSVRVTPGSLEFVSLGAAEQLSAVGVDDDGNVVSRQVDSWSSTDQEVVTITGEGRATAVGNGLARVRATIAGVTGEAAVQVDQEIASITLSPTSGALTALGETLQLDVFAEDAAGFEVTSAPVAWSSSDPTVVTVDDSGLVQAVGNGVTQVSAATSSVSASADLQVDQIPVGLAFVVQPSDGYSEGGFDPPVEVSVLDALGSPVVDESLTVELTFAENATGAQLLGSRMVSTVDGVSVFEDLAVDRSGTDYRLEASAVGVSPDTSVAFRVRAAPFAYVADNQDANVSVVNVVTGERVAVISVGERPYAVASSQDGSLVYVTNGLSNSVSVVETEGNTVIASVPVGEAPRGVATTPDGLTLVAHGNVLQDSVWYIDQSDQSVTDKAEVARGNEGIAVSPDGTTALVTASADDVVSMLDIAARSTLMDIAVGDFPRRVVLAPDGSRAYVTLYNSEQLAVVELPSGAVLERVDVSTNPVDVAVSPDGSRIFITHFPFSTSVSVMDAESNTLVKSIALAGGPHSITMGPYGELAYVTHDPSSLSVIDLETLEVISTFEVGGNPLGVVVIVPGSSP